MVDVLARHYNVFKQELGTLREHQVNIHVDPAAHPRFYKARPLLHALMDGVDAEIDRLLRLGIITPVKQSQLAAPVLPVVKRDNSIHLCGDYKITVNQASPPDPYPIPGIEDLYATLADGKIFTKLNMSQAYQQLELDVPSRAFTTINTHRDIFQYTRLPFGVSGLPDIFQRTIKNVLQGIPHVSVYLDDILITGTSGQEHLEKLELVLQCLE